MVEVPDFQPIPIGHQQFYHALLGVFHSNWSAIDLYTDIATMQFLGITPEQTHLITSGMVWGRKARLLADLIGHSSDTRRSALMTALNKIRAAKRDIFAHSYVASDAIHITFLERLTSGPFKIKEHVFTLEEFGEHARSVHGNA